MSTASDMMAVCAACDKFTLRSFVCDSVKRDIYHKIMSGVPFCPLGKHVNMGRAVPEKKRRSVAAGIANILIYAMRLCPTPGQAKAARRAECSSCEYKKTRLRLFSICGVCKCWLMAKTGNANQSCPIGKWRREKAAMCFDGTSLPVIGSMMPKKCGGCANAG